MLKVHSEPDVNHRWAITQFAQLELLVLILVGKNSSRKSSKAPIACQKEKNHLGSIRKLKK
jgi:hypothetical protein